MCLSVTLHIVDLWQYYVCCTSSGVTRCTFFIVLFLCRCGSHATLWSHIGTLIMRLLAAERSSIAGLLFHCQYLCRTTLVTPYSTVFDWRVSRAGPMPFYWPSCQPHFCLLIFPFSSFILWSELWGSSDWYCVNGSLPALHYQPFLIIIIIIT